MTRDATMSPGRKDWRFASATAIWCSLIIIAVIVLSRKAAGAFENQLPVNVACLVAMAATVLSLTASVLFQSHRRTKMARIVAGVVTLVPPMTLGVALLPDGSIAAVTFLPILFLFASLAMVVLGEKHFMHAGAESGTTNADRPQSFRGDEIDECIRIPSRIADSSPQLSQWMTRTLTDDGRDQIEGSVKVDFSQSQKQATVHLTFSPPFVERPELTCEILNDCPARLTVSVIQTYGARIDVRRTSTNSDAETADVGFRAAANSANSMRKSDAA